MKTPLFWKKPVVRFWMDTAVPHRSWIMPRINDGLVDFECAYVARPQAQLAIVDSNEAAEREITNGLKVILLAWHIPNPLKERPGILAVILTKDTEIVEVQHAIASLYGMVIPGPAMKVSRPRPSLHELALVAAQT